jgi:hypothetical protein
MKNGFPAPNKKLAINQKQLLDRKSPIQVRIHLPPAVSQANFRIAPLARLDLVERQPELLAHHLTAVGDIEQ